VTVACPEECLSPIASRFIARGPVLAVEFISAVVGALFGWLLGAKAIAYGSGATLGAVWGVVWWVLGGLILMPMFLGMPVFAPLRMAPMRPVAMGSLVGHLIYGIIAGLVYVRLRRGAGTETSTRAHAV
jgi:hypothetical protein